MVATRNPGKIKEIDQIMSGLPIRLVLDSDIPDVEETGTTYLENALLKARAVLAATGKASLADDSGLEVDALDGVPGVRSARLAGPNATDEQNNIRLISLMSGVPTKRRSARYRCVAVVAFPDGEELAAIGTCEGSISEEARGTEGFGYDPWFVPEGETRTMAELSSDAKNAISHRGKAFRGLADALRRRLQD